MRAHSWEHRDSLPVLDVTALRHIAYVLDGIIFYMRSGKESDLDKTDANIWTDQDENENDDTEDELQLDGVDFYDNIVYGLGTSQGRRQSFFQRSESTLCLGCPPPDPFNSPICESLPLADQPHLLQPNARREDIFGIPKQPITIPTNGNETPGINSPLELPPTTLGLSARKKISDLITNLTGHQQPVEFEIQQSFAADPAHSSSSRTEASCENATASTATMDCDPTINDDKTNIEKAETKQTRIPDDLHNIPSTSKESMRKRRLSDHSSSDSNVLGNIYMQLKKKTYYDQYEEETRSFDNNKKEGTFASIDR